MSPSRESRSELERSHTPDAIERRLGGGPTHSYLRDFIYGAVDGSVTTFSVVSAVAGAGLSPGIIIILGAANLVGDGFSMAASSFLATRAEDRQRERARLREESHIQRIPEGEREEVRQIFARKGFSGEDLDRVVEVITSDRRQWVDTMMREELGMATEGPSPWRAALTTFSAFNIIGLLPLLPFILELARSGMTGAPFGWSALLTGIAFFIVGALKGRFLDEKWYLAGLETLGVGGAAAALSYVVGYLIKTATGTMG